MYEDSSPIASLVHLYFDGAFSRRELVRRVAGHTGSIAAAAAVLTNMGVAEAQQLSCPADVTVPPDAPDAPDMVTQDVQFPGDAGPILAYMAQPRTDDPSPIDRALTGQTPAIITGLLSRQKTFGLHIYQGANHAFHDDTGPAYNPAAACDAWFHKFLKQPQANP